jgi:hypothetical protein
MKRIRNLLELGAVIILLLASASDALADPQWVEVTVETAGYSAGSAIGIKLTHNSQSPLFTSKWYKARSDVSEGMLSSHHARRNRAFSSESSCLS